MNIINNQHAGQTCSDIVLLQTYQTHLSRQNTMAARIGSGNETSVDSTTNFIQNRQSRTARNQIMHLYVRFHGSVTDQVVAKELCLSSVTTASPSSARMIHSVQ